MTGFTFDPHDTQTMAVQHHAADDIAPGQKRLKLLNHEADCAMVYG